MTLVACVALLSVVIAVPAAAQTMPNPDPWRIREVALSAPPTPQPIIEVGSYGRIALGMFGPKAESSRSRPVTVGEITAPRHRRAGVGFSLKF